MSYRVNAEWDDTGWWVVTVPDVPGAINQTRRLEQVPAEAAEVIEIQTGQEVDPESLDVFPCLPGEAGEAAAEARKLRAESQELGKLASECTHLAVWLLHQRGFPLRDIGALTGITYQRAQQLVKGDPKRNPRDAHEAIEGLRDRWSILKREGHTTDFDKLEAELGLNA